MESIVIKNIKKSYRVYFDKARTLKDTILFQNRNRYETHDVLKDISIQIKRGETVGLIGQNGCGKSTLLKLMSRIIYPDSGSIELKGKVSSLLELGAGFHPDLTGRANIFMNASIFGISNRETKKRIDKIIDFSELHDSIDNPIRTYSSGMYMRLAFAVAINVDADILLIDEILAVGDQKFQKKCFEKLYHLKNEGKTIVIVSHDLDSVKKFCDRCIWINEGFVLNQGEPDRVIEQYITYQHSGDTCG